MIEAHSYKLGREQIFNFMNGASYLIANRDVREVTCTFETSAEAEVTTRGSGNESEFYPVRKNTQFEVVVLSHNLRMHATGTVFVSANELSLLTGVTGTTGFGHFYVNAISEPHDQDGATVYTITLRRTAIFSG